jgi:hypothetical protein
MLTPQQAAQFPDAAETMERMEREKQLLDTMDIVNAAFRQMAYTLGESVRSMADVITKLAIIKLGSRPIKHRGRPNRRARKAEKMFARAMARRSSC